MPTETVYKGRAIRLTANQNPDGNWRGAASFLDDPGSVVETEATFPTEDEALSAALSRAMENVDRNRMSRGKP